jgi:iron complex transport system substrate-binding protein
LQAAPFRLAWRDGLFMVKRILAAGVAISLLAGCAPRTQAAPHPRIISYSPSVTDIIVDLGLADHLVGVTRYCLLPPGESRPVVGDEEKPNSEFIASLQPDIIFHQGKGENFRSVQQRLPGAKIISVKTDSVAGILDSIRTIADAAGQPQRGMELAEKIHSRLDALRGEYAAGPHPRVFFAMGYDHPGTIGGGTYLDELIGLVGGANVAGDMTGYPQVNAEWVLAARPDVVICQVDNDSQLEPARRYWLGLAGLPAARSGRVYVTADPRVTFYGSRIAQLAEQLALWIHPPAATEKAP